MKIFLSCVSSEFQSYRLRLANQLGALKGAPCEVRVQEDFEQGGFTLLDQLADYIRACDRVIHLVGDACGARPTEEHARAMFSHLAIPPPLPFPDRSYTQWEFDLAQRFARSVLCYIASPDAPRDCAKPIEQTALEADLQRSHRALIENSGKHYELFSSHAELVLRVFYDLGLKSELKVNNLPYRSLGSLFKGREVFLAQLRETLGQAEHRGHLRVAAITATATAAAVHGLGGIGKTRAALEYAHRYADEYTALLFVQADSPASLQQNLAALCGPMVLDLAAKDERETEKQLAAVLQWLQQHPGWFLILDNVDTEEAARAVQDVLARISRAGQVVITSRLANWEGSVEALALDVLAEDDAAAFLLERTEGRRRREDDDPEQALLLSRELGQLALALEQAGAYIVRYRATFAAYLEEWHRNRDRVLSWFDERTMQYPRSVAITWQTSFDRLSPPARALLRLLSWVAPDPFPESMLATVEKAFVPAAADASDPAEDHNPISDARDALAELADYSLVKRLEDEPAFLVHRLVQDVTRRTINDEDRSNSVLQALRWIDASFNFKGILDDQRDWPILVPLVPHVAAITAFAEQQDVSYPTSELLNRAGLLFSSKAQYAQAESFHRRALAIVERSAPPGHPGLAVGLQNLALILKATNRPQEAEDLYRRAIEIREKALGPDHESLATILSNLGTLLKDTGRLDEAEAVARRALAIRERALGPGDFNVARNLDLLGQIMFKTSRASEGEALMRRALAIYEENYGPDHVSVAGELNNLAALLMTNNRADEAEPLCRRCVAIEEKVYGPDHPNVAAALGVLANLLRISHRPKEAEPLFRRALATDWKVYGPDHPQVAMDLNNLGLALTDMHQFAEAEQALTSAYRIAGKTLSAGHPDMANVLNNLGMLYHETDRAALAFFAIYRSMSILHDFQRKTGHRHSLTRVVTLNLAEVGLHCISDWFKAILSRVFHPFRRRPKDPQP